MESSKRTRPAAWIAAGLTVAIAAAAVASLLAEPEQSLLDIAGFTVFVLGTGRALLLWHVDDLVFEERRTFDEATRHRKGRLAAAAAVATLAVTGAALGQQTIFNVPTADVLDRGKVYLEEDTLWRPQDRSFAIFTVRGVYGFGGRVEAGVNLGGFLTPGRSTPVGIAAVKWQPLKVGSFALTAGAHGLFFLRGAEDGDPSGQFYAHGSYAFPTNTRLTAGGWVATTGYAAAKTTGGALAALEQKLAEHLNLIADWYGGRNGIGYFTPGFSSAWGGFTLYAGYSFKNGDSKGNAALFELGFTF
jgi:hypothetical protein